MKNNRNLLLASFAVAQCLTPLWANEIEVIEVFGNFNPIAANQLPASTYILEQQDLRSIVGASALDVLEQVPGITVKQSGTVQEIFLRGAETNFVVIQIDGVQVNNPLDTRGGSVDLGSIAKSSLLRVEVTKGAQSSHQGSDAVVGVINFITLDTAQNTTVLNAGILPKGQKAFNIRSGFKDTALSASVVNSDTQPDGSRQNLTELALLTEQQWLSNGQTRINVRYGDYSLRAFADQSGGVLFTSAAAKDKKQSESLSISVRHNQTVTSDYKTSLQLEYFSVQDTLNSPGIPPYFNAPPTRSENDYSFRKLRWLNGIDLSHGYVTLGLDYKSEEGENMGLMTLFGSDIATDFRHQRDNIAGFVDLTWRFQNLSLFAGVRHDSTEDFNEQTTWKLAADFAIASQTRLFANIGMAFKLPSLYALGNNLIGNPELAPEEAKNADVGIEWRGQNSSLSANVFYYQYQDLIDFDGAAFALVNRSQIDSQGIELVAETDLCASLSVNSALTYLDLSADEGELLTGRPQWQGKIGVRWQARDNLALSANWQYVDSTSATSLHTGDFSAHQLRSINQLDMTAQWQFQSDKALDFYLQNALDHSYQVAVGVPGDELALGFNFHWSID